VNLKSCNKHILDLLNLSFGELRV